MRATRDMIDLSIKIIIAYVVNMLSQEHGIPREEAFRSFAQSKTFSLLSIGKAKLYTESPEYVLDLFKSEKNGDIAYWLDV